MFSEGSGYAKRLLAAQWSGKQSYLKSTSTLKEVVWLKYGHGSCMHYEEIVSSVPASQLAMMSP